MVASVLFRVTMVGFETIFALLSCWREENTAERTLLAAPVPVVPAKMLLAALIPLVTAFPAWFAMVLFVPVVAVLLGTPFVVWFVVVLFEPLPRLVELLLLEPYWFE